MSSSEEERSGDDTKAGSKRLRQDDDGENGGEAVVTKKRGINLDDFADDESEELRPTRAEVEERAAAEASLDDDAANGGNEDEQDHLEMEASGGSDAEGDDAREVPEEGRPEAESESERDVRQEIVFDPAIERSVVKMPPEKSIRIGPGVSVFKTSNILGVCFTPFDSSRFSASEEANPDSWDTAFRTGGSAGAVMRWRMKDRNMDAERLLTTPMTEVSSLVETNSRLVEWEDGSRTLHVGKDVFYVKEEPVMADHPLQAFHRQANVQVSEGMVSSKMSLHPADRSMLVQIPIDKKNIVKRRGIGIDKALKDPEREEQEAIKAAAERERAKARREAQQRRRAQRELEQAAGQRGYQARYLEAGDDGDAEDSGVDEDDFEELTSGMQRRNQETTRRAPEDPDRLMSIKRGDREEPTKRRRKLTVNTDDEGSE